MYDFAVAGNAEKPQRAQAVSVSQVPNHLSVIGNQPAPQYASGGDAFGANSVAGYLLERMDAAGRDMEAAQNDPNNWLTSRAVYAAKMGANKRLLDAVQIDNAVRAQAEQAAAHAQNLGLQQQQLADTSAYHQGLLDTQRSAQQLTGQHYANTEATTAAALQLQRERMQQEAQLAARPQLGVHDLVETRLDGTTTRTPLFYDVHDPNLLQAQQEAQARLAAAKQRTQGLVAPRK